MVSYNPKNLGEALVLLNNHKGATVFAGGTDLMVTERFSDTVVFINGLEELKRICREGECLRLGSCLTYTELIRANIPDILKDVFSQIASPAIRNRGTIGGNICNASPAGDTLPMLYALGACVELACADKDGRVIRRIVQIHDFIQGVRKISRRENEILTAVLIPLENFRENTLFYFKKVGARRSEAISKLSVFGTAYVEQGKILYADIAMGAVGPTVVTSRDSGVTWKDISKEDLKRQENEIVSTYMQSVHPIDDQRSTASYRRKVAENLLRDYISQIQKMM